MTGTTDAMPRLRILAAGWEGGGNVPPTLAALGALAARGHDVRFIADDTMRQEAAAAGLRFMPWKRAPNRPDRTTQSCFVKDGDIADPMAAFHKWCETIFIGPAADYAQDILDALAAEPADMLIGSDLLFGSMVAAEAAGLPSALLATNISLWPLPGHPPFGPGFLPARNEGERMRDAEVSTMVEGLWNGFLPQLNHARVGFGLAPLARVADQPPRAGRYLLATSPSFDFPCAALPAHVAYVGPMLDMPSWASEAWEPRPAPDKRPLVLVSFSTTDQGQVGTLQRVVAGLAGEPVDVVVTLGKALEGLALPVGANTTVLAHASHEAILARADAVVTHGGHGTTLRALSHGLPLVVMPMGRDQNDNAARVEFHGAGLRLDPAASPAAIAEAVKRLIAEPQFRQRAAALRAALVREGRGADRFVAAIEALAAAGRAAEPVRAA